MDSTGTRIAYLDVSKLMQTDPMIEYTGRPVQVYGIVQRIPDSKAIVVAVESLQLK